MRMPNAERAVVEMAKLTEYCLGPDHPQGKPKARVFAAVPVWPPGMQTYCTKP